MGKVKDGAKWCKDKSKEGLVEFITDDKVIQAGMTSSAFGMMNTHFEVIGLLVAGQTAIPKLIQSVLTGVMFAILFWADRNKQRFEVLVQDAANSDEDIQKTLGDVLDNNG